MAADKRYTVDTSEGQQGDQPSYTVILSPNYSTFICLASESKYLSAELLLFSSNCNLLFKITFFVSDIMSQLCDFCTLGPVREKCIYLKCMIRDLKYMLQVTEKNAARFEKNAN